MKVARQFYWRVGRYQADRVPEGRLKR